MTAAEVAAHEHIPLGTAKIRFVRRITSTETVGLSPMRESGMTTINDDLIKRSADIHWPVGFDPVHADLFAHNAVVINAPAKRIWARLIAAATWPNWY